MNFKLLKIGDIVSDKVTGAKFSVVEINSDSVLPICLKLITDIKEPIYLNFRAYASAYFNEIGEELWVFNNKQEAYNYYLPTITYQRRILTCEDLVLESTSPWIKPKETKEEGVEDIEIGSILEFRNGSEYGKFLVVSIETKFSFEKVATLRLIKPINNPIDTTPNTGLGTFSKVGDTLTILNNENQYWSEFGCKPKSNTILLDRCFLVLK